MQALLESGQCEDTSAMLMQLLECAVLEQVPSFAMAAPSRNALMPQQRFSDASHFKFLLYRCALEAGATSEQVGAVLQDFGSGVDVVAGAVAPPRGLALPRVCCRF
jgi:hypothetical protein